MDALSEMIVVVMLLGPLLPSPSCIVGALEVSSRFAPDRTGSLLARQGPETGAKSYGTIAFKWQGAQIRAAW